MQFEVYAHSLCHTQCTVLCSITCMALFSSVLFCRSFLFNIRGSEAKSCEKCVYMVLVGMTTPLPCPSVPLCARVPESAALIMIDVALIPLHPCNACNTGNACDIAMPYRYQPCNGNGITQPNIARAHTLHTHTAHQRWSTAHVRPDPHQHALVVHSDHCNSARLKLVAFYAHFGLIIPYILFSAIINRNKHYG